jgi:threonine aldolase
MKPSRGFASDNNAGVHPDVLAALAAANQGHVVGYGADPFTRSATRVFQKHFGADSEVFAVFNGSAANVLGLRAVTRSHHAVLCAEGAHIDVDECGASEAWIGCKLIPVPAEDGKLTVKALTAAYRGVGDEHHAQPRVVAISQATERGTVYKPREVEALAAFAHARNMVLHMDGARISNAAARLGLTLRQATRDLGVDVLSFGGTKNGGMGADAIVFFDKRHAAEFRFLRKQGLQLASKMRFLSVQLEALLTNDLWLKNARHSNRMARLLAKEVSRIPGVSVVYDVDANGVFARVPRRVISRLLKRYFFYTWDGRESIVRWMCSFDTTEAEVRDFAGFLARLVG